MMMMADLALILLTSVRDKYVDELSTYYAIGVGKLESFEVNIFVLSRFFLSLSFDLLFESDVF